MHWGFGCAPIAKVALLAEGVDRNSGAHALPGRMTESPSSRRAWIEIQQPHPSSDGQ